MPYTSPPSCSLHCRNKTLKLGAHTLIMGILNITPDSFSDGGRYLDPRQAVDRAQQMADEGADLIDIGGESTRPAGPYGEGAQPVSTKEEIRRTVPVIQEIANKIDLPISIDTTKAAVAQAALDAGAVIVNDISALRFDPVMAGVVAQSKAGVVLMHMKGTPRTMQAHPTYTNLMDEILAFLSERRCKALEAGILQNRILLDPGLGFGKQYAHNFEIIARLEEFHNLNAPLLVGPSRKKFVGEPLSLPPEERLEGTLAALAFCVAGGAHILRVHDVKAARRAVQVAERIVASINTLPSSPKTT